MIKALDLAPHNWRNETLSAEFKALGFRRERHLFSLKENGHLKAVLIAYLSDIGLNLSDLTHCIKVLVLDSQHLPPETLFAALHRVCQTTGQKDVPALIYPLSYAERYSIPFEKTYNLWIVHMNTQIQTYFKYLSRLLRYV